MLLQVWTCVDYKMVGEAVKLPVMPADTAYSFGLRGGLPFRPSATELIYCEIADLIRAELVNLSEFKLAISRSSR